VQEWIKELDLDTACMLTDEAEPSAGRLLPMAKSRLNHSRALNEGECTVLISVSTELADAAPLLSGQTSSEHPVVENCMEVGRCWATYISMSL
jgi:hypothetical protein